MYFPNEKESRAKECQIEESKKGRTMKAKKLKERAYFQFFRDWYEPLQIVDDPNTKFVLLDAVIRYSLYGDEPTESDMKEWGAIGAMYWKTIFPNLKKSRQNFLNGVNSPGAPKGNKNAAKFETPSFDMIERYFEIKGFRSDPKSFFDYNERTGWENAKRHFKTWQVAADRWEEMGDEYNE